MKRKDVRDSCLYFDITNQERDSAIRYLLGAIMQTRQASNFPSNYYTFDEDVNVYLAHLLFAISLPEYHEMAEPYLSTDTSDVLRNVRNAEDQTIRYFIYKVNADHVLIHTGVFDDIRGKNSNKFFKKSSRHYREMAKLYYDQAAAYHKRIYRRRTGVGEVLEKMSYYFEAYVGLLKRVRRDYFNFVNGFRDQAFSHFMNEMKSYEAGYLKKSLMDQFLDVYSKWLETKNPEMEARLRKIVSDLKSVDPSFRFDLDDQQGGGWIDERKCA